MQECFRLEMVGEENMVFTRIKDGHVIRHFFNDDHFSVDGRSDQE